MWATPGELWRLLVGDGVGEARGGEALEAQAAGGAPAAGSDLVLVARPGEFEGRAQFKPQAHDAPFVQVDQGGVDGKVGFGPGAQFDEAVEGLKIAGRQSG